MRNINKRRVFPAYYAKSVLDVTPEFIRACGCSAVMADIDNTISHVDAPDATPEGERWMNILREAGIPFGFISNNDPPRVEPFAEKYGAGYFCHAEKPKPNGYYKLAEQLKKPVSECMLVGDQLFTDVLGGNNAGMCTVIVTPLCENDDPVAFRKRRKLEKLLLGIDRVFCKKERRIGGV